MVVTELTTTPLSSFSNLFFNNFFFGESSLVRKAKEQWGQEKKKRKEMEKA